MPIIQLIHSDNIFGMDYQPIYKKIHQVLSTITDPNTVKIFPLPEQTVKSCMIGDGHPRNTAVFLEIKLLVKDERTDELKGKIGLEITKILQDAFSPKIKSFGLRPCEPTVELTDLQVYAIGNKVYDKKGRQLLFDKKDQPQPPTRAADPAPVQLVSRL